MAAVLLAQAVPAATALLAAAGHAVFHLSERMAQVQAERMEHERERLARESVTFEHSHGPGQEVHTHVAPVDVVLQLAASSEDADPEPTVPVDQRVDQHVPPDSEAATIRPLAESAEPADPARSRSLSPFPPPLRPPRA